MVEVYMGFVASGMMLVSYHIFAEAMATYLLTRHADMVSKYFGFIGMASR